MHVHAPAGLAHPARLRTRTHARSRAYSMPGRLVNAKHVVSTRVDLPTLYVAVRAVQVRYHIVMPGIQTCLLT
jgi:hypothetical protein